MASSLLWACVSQCEPSDPHLYHPWGSLVARCPNSRLSFLSAYKASTWKSSSSKWSIPRPHPCQWCNWKPLPMPQGVYSPYSLPMQRVASLKPVSGEGFSSCTHTNRDPANPPTWLSFIPSHLAQGTMVPGYPEGKSKTRLAPMVSAECDLKRLSPGEISHHLDGWPLAIPLTFPIQLFTYRVMTIIKPISPRHYEDRTVWQYVNAM